MKSAIRVPIAKPLASGERPGGTATNRVSQSSSFMVFSELRIECAFLAPGHQCFRRRTGTGLNFALRRRLAHAHQETEQQISPQQGEIASG
jgi:hypothetical protein